ncbi:MAG: IS66 family insertion sequence element accessory protein TnpB [Azospirillum sp.]|nr:IS66 family insertion sequence element accessory protein TnpB [Azospirillum sp.]
MRRGMKGLALQVQEGLGRDPDAGDLYVFRRARGDLVKIIWHDGLGMSLYAKRRESGRLTWPGPADGVVAISAAQLAYLLDGIDWRNPRQTFRPARAGWHRAAFFSVDTFDFCAAWRAVCGFYRGP